MDASDKTIKSAEASNEGRCPVKCGAGVKYRWSPFRGIVPKGTPSCADDDEADNAKDEVTNHQDNEAKQKDNED